MTLRIMLLLLLLMMMMTRGAGEATDAGGKGCVCVRGWWWGWRGSVRVTANNLVTACLVADTQGSCPHPPYVWWAV